MSGRFLQSRSVPTLPVKGWRKRSIATLGLVLILAGAILAFPRLYQAYAGPAIHKASAGDWPTYMYNASRSGYNSAETIINRTSAGHLKFHWNSPTRGNVFSQPVVADGMVIWGSFDGYEHAVDLNGHLLWHQYLGAATSCVPYIPLGVVSSAAVASVPVNGTNTLVAFVGGGNDYLYALNALTGAVIWKTAIGNPATNTFIWDSPLVINNNVYIGSATTGESSGCKLIPGQFSELNASTGAIEYTYHTVPPGCVGGGIWSSPTYDPTEGSFFLTAGTQGTCSNDHISIGIVKLAASNLAYQDSWQIPLKQRLTNDADFATTPTLFTAKINGVQQNMVGATDKNGYFYAFYRASLSRGPVWSVKIASPGACPQCGTSSISSAVWDGTNLFVAGSATKTASGKTCGGTVQELNPANGHFNWQACLQKTVIGSLTEVPGVLALIEGGDGSNIILLNTATGATLGTLTGTFYGSPSISNGVLYAGSTNGGGLYAFGT
jgi:hypothetical protein